MKKSLLIFLMILPILVHSQRIKIPISLQKKAQKIAIEAVSRLAEEVVTYQAQRFINDKKRELYNRYKTNSQQIPSTACELAAYFRKMGNYNLARHYKKQCGCRDYSYLPRMVVMPNNQRFQYLYQNSITKNQKNYEFKNQKRIIAKQPNY